MPDSCFYRDGLRFQCTRCSRCCRHTPGYVFLSADDVATLCRLLGLSRSDLVAQYCRSVSIGPFQRMSLSEKKNLDCIFWGDGGCTVYEARPLQCRSFPFWSSCLASAAEWSEYASQCPGIGKGRLHSRKEIDGWLRQRAAEGFLES